MSPETGAVLGCIDIRLPQSFTSLPTIGEEEAGVGCHGWHGGGEKGWVFLTPQLVPVQVQCNAVSASRLKGVEGEAF